MKRKVTVVLGPWSEHPLEARQCLYEQFEVEVENGTQRVLAVAVENEEPSPKGGEAIMYHSSATIVSGHDIDNLVGKLLTYIDATYSDKDQRNAHKDIARQTVWDWFNHHDRNGNKTIRFAQEQVK